MDINNGWVKLHKKFTEWEWYTEPNVLRLFLHCLLKSNFEDKNWKGVNIKRGSFITSYSHLSKELKLSVKKIRTALNKLKLTNEVAIKTTNQYTVIQIVNYNLYQSRASEKAIKGQSKGNQRATTKEDKEIKEDNKKKPPQKKEFIPPTKIEFMLFAKSKLQDDVYQKSKQKLEWKWEAWDVSGWINGRTDKPMKSWQSTLLNTIPHL